MTNAPERQHYNLTLAILTMAGTAFNHWNWVVGVRPAARVSTQKIASGFIWIESGYVWLLWAGGIPLLLSFFYFLWRAAASRSLSCARARMRRGSGPRRHRRVQRLGVLMTIDPHVTYRGSADLLFALLGIVAAARAMPSDEPETG